jgi:hypothetical protein
MPFISCHDLMFQHDNARPHVTRIYTQFLEAKNVPVLPWLAYSPDMSHIEHVWDALYQRVRQRVPVPTNIQQLHTGDVCMRQILVTPDTNWFSDFKKCQGTVHSESIQSPSLTPY